MNSTTYMFRLPKGGDLLEELTTRCDSLGVTTGTITVIGALQHAVLGFYDQMELTYQVHPLDEPMELLAGIGNVSLKDEQPFVHLHLTLADRTGACRGGHAMEGCRIFAAEAVITSLPEEILVRRHDPETGLALWE
ncbi:MAG: PPC domain-containing DNA-binding protein [Desulfovibrionales bacterium]